MARRSEHSREELKDMIIEAATRIVNSEGFARLSARKIAGDIGYTVGTLYMVFENLDELVLHINANTLDDLQESLTHSVANCHQPRQCLLAMAKAYLYFSQKNPSLWSMIFEHRLPEGYSMPSWYQEKINAIFALVESNVDSLSSRSSTRTQVAQVLWAGVHGITILAHTGKLDSAHATDPEKLIELQIKTLTNGLQ